VQLGVADADTGIGADQSGTGCIRVK